MARQPLQMQAERLRPQTRHSSSTECLQPSLSDQQLEDYPTDLSEKIRAFNGEIKQLQMAGGGGPAYLEQERGCPATVGLKSPFLVPLFLLAAAAFFLMEEVREPRLSDPSVAPADSTSDVVVPKPSDDQALLFSQKCLKRSNAIYAEEVYEFEAIERKVGYFRMRDDRYGKGFHAITKERLAREAEC